MLAYAVAVGIELNEAKKVLPHGDFIPWCEANLMFGKTQRQTYMKLANSQRADLFDAEVSIRAAIVAATEAKPPAPVPQFTQDDAERILKLAAMANGGNVNEEIVACEMLDKMASRFGLFAQSRAKPPASPEGPTMRKPTPSPVPPGFKHCYTCATDKPVQFFYRNRAAHDGHCSRCIPCESIAAADRRHRQRILKATWVHLKGR